MIHRTFLKSALAAVAGLLGVRASQAAQVVSCKIPYTKLSCDALNLDVLVENVVDETGNPHWLGFTHRFTFHRVVGPAVIMQAFYEQFSNVYHLNNMPDLQLEKYAEGILIEKLVLSGALMVGAGASATDNGVTLGEHWVFVVKNVTGVHDEDGRVGSRPA